jgi:hypothetical protein
VEQQSSVVVHDGLAVAPAETAGHHCLFVAALGDLACLEDLDLAAAEPPWCRIWLRQLQKVLESARRVGVVREVCAEGRKDVRNYEEIFRRGRECSQIEPVQLCEKFPRYGRTINRTIREGSCNPQLPPLLQLTKAV